MVKSYNIKNKSIVELEKEIKIDFANINYPEKKWTPEILGPNKKPLTDVLIIGGGMNGLSVAFSLRRLGITNIKIIDKNPKGYMGPWKNSARMNYLRSPKHLVGPAQNFPKLTFRSWWERNNPKMKWDDFEYIKREEWADYLIWFAKITKSKVYNKHEVLSIIPSKYNKNLELNYVKTKISVNKNKFSYLDTIYSRLVILATGRESLGKPRITKVFENHFRKNVFHSSQTINFDKFKNKNVAIIGAAASAFDNAALVAEKKAKNVTIIARAKKIPTLNKMKQTVYPGFAEGFYQLSDSEKVKWLNHIIKSKIAPPKKSVDRISKTNTKIIFNVLPVELKKETNQYLLVLENNDNKSKEFLNLDFIILCTGFKVDIYASKELRQIASDILLWKDKIKKNHKEYENLKEILEFPYLGEGFEFKSKKNIKNNFHLIRCFNHASLISLGNLANDIPHSGFGANRLAKSIAKYLFKEDKKYHFKKI